VPVTIRRDASGGSQSDEDRNPFLSIVKGWKGRCPSCGNGRLFSSFLKPVHSCGSCGEDMHHQRADDLPPYLVIFIVGHIMVGGYLLVEQYLTLNSWQYLAILVPITLVMALALMQPVKGAVIGLQWANRMHGFGGEADLPEELEASDT
jgi:uncharacterized protein (DUF983 family)